MKLLLVFFVSLLFFIGCSPNEEAPQNSDVNVEKNESQIKTIAGLPWYLNMQRGFSRAEKEGKDVIVMIEEDTCKWCKKMKEDTLTDKRIQGKLRQYVLVSIKRSDKSSVKQIPEFDGNIPSFFFMQANKEMIEPVVGYFKADDFLSYIEELEE